MKNKYKLENVLNFIKNYKDLSKHEKSTSIKMINIAAKLQVENNAINRVQIYIKREGFTVISVEKDNVDWDLEVISGLLKFKVEGKVSTEMYI
ncbi:hypothetical protein [Bacillus toyonensis]|uniref:hypothetical protein n=2 Tax=Bacillus toyonensis TaxID=155322 RepID=UPI000BF00601|nr:hypothetical protein [Bacillus toyonensis]PEJ97142.1 hypothetical protein CN687_11780 [Bacillus toyonensis]PEL02992.1 hypothetical protein CN614_24210 [Bacillus toyonensis]PEP03535.1 hypothetical protein CN577_25660 [Bacillus toyonensis]PEU38863.1 hypothetical protein CN537_19275 [Bacillus toyonensis]PFY39068.1 hypothetical protein COL50_24865 [Bacillus toyonensis]